MKSINPYIQEAKYIPNRMNEHLSRLIQIFKTQRLKQQQQKSGKQSEEKKKRKESKREKRVNTCDTNHHWLLIGDNGTRGQKCNILKVLKFNTMF